MKKLNIFTMKQFFAIAILLQASLCIDMVAITYGSAASILLFPAQLILNNGDIIETGSSLIGGFNINSGTVAFHSRLPVTGDVSFNGNTISLASDLTFDNITTITSWGTIEANGYHVVFGTSVNSWTGSTVFDNAHVSISAPDNTVSGTVCFSGTSSLNGEGGLFDLSSGGTIKVASGSTLYISDMVIKGIGNSYGSFDIASDAEVIFSNVTFEMKDDYTTSSGTFTFNGPATILVKDHTWSFGVNSSVVIDGVTVWKDVVGEYYEGGDVTFGNNVLTLLHDGFIKFIYGGIINDIEECLELLCEKVECDKIFEIFEDTEITQVYIPNQGQTHIFILNNACITFDGNAEGVGGCIVLEEDARMIFKGTGQVKLRNGICLDVSRGQFELLEKVSLFVDKCSQLITDQDQIRYDLFKTILRKVKSRMEDYWW